MQGFRVEGFKGLGSKLPKGGSVGHYIGKYDRIYEFRAILGV